MVGSAINQAGKTLRDRGAEAVESGFAEANRLEGNMRRLGVWPFEIWLRCQAELLRTAEPATLGMLQRQRDAVDAGLQTITKLITCTDFKEALAIQNAWFEGAVRRFGANLQAFAEQAAAVSRDTATALQQTALVPPDFAAAGTKAAAHHEGQIERAA